MPISLALEFINVATARQISNAKNPQNALPSPQADVPISETGTRQVATRRKSKQLIRGNHEQ